MIRLTDADRKYWAPVPEIVNWLSNRLPRGAEVLEIGACHVQFPRATMFVDFQDVPEIPPEKLVKCDVTKERLPFQDKSFDFVYCRHALEDMHNPFLACAEMSRVAKSGYIETPSPIAELCRGVDGGSPIYRGYHHHRYIVWCCGDELRFVAKYPLVEYLLLDDQAFASTLRKRSRYWNTHHLWKDQVNATHLQNSVNFDMMRDYATIINGAVDESVASIDAFWLRCGDGENISMGEPCQPMS